MSNTTMEETKTLYDLYILLSPSAMERDISALEEEITQELRQHDAEVKKQTKFAKQDLAYPINKNTYAYAATVYFEAPPSAVLEIKEALRLSDIPFLRFMVTRASESALRQPKAQEKKDIELPDIPELNETPKEGKRPSGQTQTNAETAPSETQETPRTEEAGKEDERSSEQSDATRDEKAEQPKTEEKKEDSVTIDDIDERLDEIMGDL